MLSGWIDCDFSRQCVGSRDCGGGEGGIGHPGFCVVSFHDECLCVCGGEDEQKRVSYSRSGGLFV